LGTVNRDRVLPVRSQALIDQWAGDVSFQVFTPLAMKNTVFWDIKPISYLTGDILFLR
jgi:hypothetical protein